MLESAIYSGIIVLRYRAYVSTIPACNLRQRKTFLSWVVMSRNGLKWQRCRPTDLTHRFVSRELDVDPKFCSTRWADRRNYRQFRHTCMVQTARPHNGCHIVCRNVHIRTLCHFDLEGLLRIRTLHHKCRTVVQSPPPKVPSCSTVREGQNTIGGAGAVVVLTAASALPIRDVPIYMYYILFVYCLYAFLTAATALSCFLWMRGQSRCV